MSVFLGRGIIVLAIVTYFYVFTVGDSSARYLKYIVLMTFAIISLNYLKWNKN